VLRMRSRARADARARVRYAVTMTDGALYAARYWGVLNRLREAALTAHTATRASYVRVDGAGAYVFLGVIFALASGWTLYVLCNAFLERLSLSSLLVSAMLAMPGVLIAIIVAIAVRSIRRRGRERARYEARGTQRRAWRGVLEALAPRWGGEVEANGIAPCARFLAAHHPDRAPTLLLHHQAGDDEDRLSLTGTIDGAPLLVHIVDFSKPGQHIRPPALVVLVACGMELPPDIEPPKDAPFRVGAPPRLEDSAPHRALVERGLVVGWSPAGAYAAHGGPADALFDEEALASIAQSVLDFCRTAPPIPSTLAAPIAPAPICDERSEEAVADAFMRALRDRDALAALSLAHPFLFPRGPREPRPAELDLAIDAARARPRSWKKGSYTSAGATRRGLVTEFAERPAAEVDLHLTTVGERWTVIGYAIGKEQILGIEYVAPPS